MQDTGFLSAAPTLAVQQIGADALLQVHPQGIRHVLADRRVNEWRVPQGKTIVCATTNKRQVVVALSSAELVYFELDLDGQLNEYQDRKAMGSTVLALSIAEVPEGRQRTPYLVCMTSPISGRLITFLSRLLVARIKLSELFRWTPRAHSTPSVYRLSQRLRRQFASPTCLTPVLTRLSRLCSSTLVSRMVFSCGRCWILSMDN